MVRATNILVRRGRLDDAAALKAILYDTFENTWRPELTAEAVAAYLADDPPTAFVGQWGLDFQVAERDGEVVGLVYWEDDFVHSLHVRSDHARTGVGARLMDVAEAGIAKAGHRAVRLETDSFNAVSQAFYKARGYREIDRYPDTEWKSDLTTLLLKKTLA